MSPVSRDHQQQLRPVVLAQAVDAERTPAPLPRRSFLTGRVLDPELHPPLRARLARAIRHQ
jgi:hypothetical protein